MKILATDIGGTKTLVKLIDFESTFSWRVIAEQRFASQEFIAFDDILVAFLKGQPGIDAACLGIAGPVQNQGTENQQAHVTNLPWVIDKLALQNKFDLPELRLINDFEAIGYGIEGLPESDLHTLIAGEIVPEAPRAVIGAGTGLGEAFLVHHNDHYEVLPSEGGHVDFAPMDEQQIQLLRFLIRRYGHVSYERLVSGTGLVNIYRFLCDEHPENASATLSALIEREDPAAAISRAALEKNDPLARIAMELFVKIYGAQAGNLALTILAFGGVYIAGGIAPKILSALEHHYFADAFYQKGRMLRILKKIPVKVVMNPEVGLIGAMLAASRL
jgi:glucokinase